MGDSSRLNKEKIRSAIREAKEYVSDEEEPWKSLVFQVILTQLISDGGSNASLQSKNRAIDVSNAQQRDRLVESQQHTGDLEAPTLSIPEHSLEKILALKEREQIPILWSLSSQQSMTVDGFLTACEKAGVTISRSYSPTKGGNFRNRLFKEDKMFVEDSKAGKVPKYKLSAAGRLKAQKFLSA